MSKKSAKEIASERVDNLFTEAAREAASGNESRAKRHVELALRMSERPKIRASHKREYCSECHAFFVPPKNVRVRTRSGRVAMTCLGCGHVQRYPISQKRRA